MFFSSVGKSVVSSVLSVSSGCFSWGGSGGILSASSCVCGEGFSGWSNMGMCVSLERGV